MIFLLTHKMQNSLPWSPSQMKFAGNDVPQQKAAVVLLRKGGESSQDPTSSICSCCPRRLSIHGGTAA